jgi:hypothetical protein
MDDSLAPLTLLLSDIILPNLKAVQSSQAEQIAANDRVEQAIDELRTHLSSQFALLSAQVAAVQIELAATRAALKAAQARSGYRVPAGKVQVH